MPNEKMENLLNLALEATPEEREKSLDLDAGYSAQGDTWEVVVKYSGEPDVLENAIYGLAPEAAGQIAVTNLSNEYVILTLPEYLVEPVANLTLVEYMEKPKRLVFAVNQEKRFPVSIRCRQAVYRIPGKIILRAGVCLWR